MTLTSLADYQSIASLFKRFRPALFGVADMHTLSGVKDQDGAPFPRAISFAMPMDKTIMSTVKTGPNQAMRLSTVLSTSALMRCAGPSWM